MSIATIRPATLEILKDWKFYDAKGKAIDWTNGQLEIIDCILHRSAPNGLRRVQINCSTQYGKSYAVAAGVLIRVCHKSEPWALVAPSKLKAGIIMDYIVMFALQNPVAKRLMQADGEKTIEKLAKRTNKDRITFMDGDLKLHSEVRTFSAEAHRKGAVSKSLMGFGSPNVIEDESALIPNDIHATVVRMVGGHPNNFLVKIGNPFNRNHFLKSWEGNKFYKIFIDYKRALSEGRYSEEFIEEMRELPLFEVLYGCEFPVDGLMDNKGWIPLISESLLERSQIDKMPMIGERKLGADIAGGGRNYSVNVVRAMNVAELVRRSNEPDTMVTATNIIEDAQDYEVAGNNISIDYIGIGRGVGDRVKQIHNRVNLFVGGEVAPDTTRFYNYRAEIYWRVKDWLENGGKLIRSKHWNELLAVKYKVVSNKKIRMMSKEEMLANNIESPDVMDGLALTFVKKDNQYQGNTNSSYNDYGNGNINIITTNPDPYAD